MAKILLSIIIPTYNVENYIVECVDSLLKQKGASSEIIIVNDGSTDGTLALVEQHYGHLPQVKIITTRNGGAGKARDIGLDAALGEFVFFCDPDDIVADGFLAELQQVYQAHPEIDLFCFSSQMFEDGHRERIRPKVRHEVFGLQPPQKVLSSLLRNGSYTSAAWNYALKKSVATQYDLRFVDRVHEDHKYTLSAFVRARHAWVSKHVYYYQRVRNGSLTNSRKSEEYFLQRYNAFMHAFSTLKHALDTSPASKALEKDYLMHSFRLMIYLSLYNGTPVPEYVINAIRFMGGQHEPANIKEWLLINRPQIFIMLQNLKVTKELKRAA
ncbi:glycosyltransferase family 2 protein [Candidatus Pantoea floridensis]|uniref:Glycosyltransferase involved in cell wall bisynthesis n=1 Tax=Candidatus Pantoea floridensis TaxID=1938870 RepID=A0A286BNB8_9GAMM|nr:glycosyltransferase family A protein [Pantoea floridensis]PIF22639.1 glycosyltransferase involved in cell wall biosynthesis [Enterobacteriaceae bacterium JKS000233]SOD35654.1 Glycosyltransferase involved in cell wall bisynthesis [Pantoea floridensis]